MRKQLEEKLRTLEQSHLEKSIHEEKELKAKMMDQEQNKEKIRMAYESRIKELEKEQSRLKSVVFEHEHTNNEIRNSELRLKHEVESLNNSRHSYEERIRTLEQINQGNLKSSEIEEKLKGQYESRIHELNREVNLYKITAGEHEKEKKNFEVRLKMELETKERTLLTEKRDETEKLKKKINLLDLEIADLKKKQMEEMRGRKDSEMDTSKITENKSKDEIYGLLNQSKIDSTEVTIRVQKDGEISRLKRILSRMKIFVACTSLIGLGLLLALLLKSNNCKETANTR